MREVSAALIVRGKTFLICKRPAGKSCAHTWEFPGGKREPGETGEQALVRECKEELGVVVRVEKELAQTSFAYPDGEIRLTLYRVFLVEGEPQPLEHEELRWILPENIPEYEFSPADTAFLERLSGGSL